jgi:hypothetical protein
VLDWPVLHLRSMLIEIVTVSKKSPIDERHPGGCWNIPGCWRSNPSESTWLRSSKEYGIGQTERKKEKSTQKVFDNEESISVQVIRLDLLLHTARSCKASAPLSRFPFFVIWLFLVTDFVALGWRLNSFVSHLRKRVVFCFCSFITT